MNIKLTENTTCPDTPSLFGSFTLVSLIHFSENLPKAKVLQPIRVI